MKLLHILITLSIIGIINASSNCDCEQNCRRKIKVKDDHHPEIKVIYTGTPCACHKALPFRVEKPKLPKIKLHKHKYNVEIKEEKCKPECRYIYNTKVEKPIVVEEELCKYPVKVEKLLEECKNNPRFIYSVKIEKPVKECETQLDGLVAKMDKMVVPVEDCPQPCCESNESSESSESSEECPKNKIKKTKKTKSCKVPEIKETGCSPQEVSSEEVEKKCIESSEEVLKESSEECHHSSEESSEEVPKKCDESSEEVPKKCEVSSEELPPNCDDFSAELSEEVIRMFSLECPEESSEEIQVESSEECKTKSEKHKRKYESSEEHNTKYESSEECKPKHETSEECSEEDHGAIYDEEHWCKGKPIKISHRYSTPEEKHSKRFSRLKRELFLNDAQDFNVCSEPRTRNEIQKTIAKIYANINKRKRKHHRRRPKTKKEYLVQNQDQFEDNNKFLEEEILLQDNEERNKRHSSKCKTIEYLKRRPKYEMDVLADAGCSQYIPEIISRNKRHLSSFDGNINFPIKFVDATTKWSIAQHPIPKKIHHQREYFKKEPKFEGNPKFYYKYLSLTAPQFIDRENEDKKIVYDHLGHKFLEYNGFRTLIKPKIEYRDDSWEDKPKFWTCKEDLINVEDFGKTTTFSSISTTQNTIENITQSTTENTTQSTTENTTENITEIPEISTTTELHNLKEHEFNLCEYLKNLSQTQNITEQNESKNVFLQNCEDYIKFLIYNPSDSKITENTTITNYLENLLHNINLKQHFKKLFHTKHKFENNLANITKLLHKPKVVDNFKNYLLFKNEFDSAKITLHLCDNYSLFQFYHDAEYVLNLDLEKNTLSTVSPNN